MAVLTKSIPRSQTQKSRPSNGNINKVQVEDQGIHDWYRFVLSYPPHLVSHYLQKFELTNKHVVLDPFCGTGTTLVEAKLKGIPSIGVEAHPMAHFASEVKTNWAVDPEELHARSLRIADVARKQLESERIWDDSDRKTSHDFKLTLRTLDPEREKLLLQDSISPVPLHKVLVLLEILDKQRDTRYMKHQLLALAKALVFSISNLRFGPEVGIGQIKEDAPVITLWLSAVTQMVKDLQKIRAVQRTKSNVLLADSRDIAAILDPRSVDAIITSPPYPNEKDYTRTTRLETVLLNFIKNKQDLQNLKRTLLRSNTRTVYKGDEDDQWVSGHRKIQGIANAIEKRRIELGKTSGFERLYPRVTRLYFGGMARHLSDLRKVLKPGAQLAYVVGDQASYLRVMIKTGQLIAEIAESLGYEVLSLDLFRTRLATATREQLREEVVVLRWPQR